jgi:hypothetical protein
MITYRDNISITLGKALMKSFNSITRMLRGAVGAERALLLANRDVFALVPNLQIGN